MSGFGKDRFYWISSISKISLQPIKHCSALDLLSLRYLHYIWLLVPCCCEITQTITGHCVSLLQRSSHTPEANWNFPGDTTLANTKSMGNNSLRCRSSSAFVLLLHNLSSHLGTCLHLKAVLCADAGIWPENQWQEIWGRVLKGAGSQSAVSVSQHTGGGGG